MRGLLVLLFLIAVVIYFPFTYGYVMYKFWYWFILPVFPTLPAITFAQAVGFKLFVSLFTITHHYQLKDEYYDEEKSTRIATAFTLPWLGLIFGYLIKIILF